MTGFKFESEIVFFASGELNLPESDRQRLPEHVHSLWTLCCVWCIMEHACIILHTCVSMILCVNVASACVWEV